MALTGTQYKVTAKSKYDDNGTIKNRTITIMTNADPAIDSDSAVREVLDYLQPLITDTLTGEVTISRIHTYEAANTVPAGVDLLEDTQDQFIYTLVNATNTKTVTIKNAAAVDPSDTAKWATLTTAVNNYSSRVLTAYMEGDYSTDQVSLRAYTDYEIE